MFIFWVILIHISGVFFLTIFCSIFSNLHFYMIKIGKLIKVDFIGTFSLKPT